MKTSVVVLAVLSLAILVSVSGRNVVQARDVWPGPDGVTATDGIHPGEAVITWSTVEKAAYYRIGWVAQPTAKLVRTAMQSGGRVSSSPTWPIGARLRT